MKNTVTFETALALKDAGFPQQNPAPGQFWYDFNGRLFIVYHEGGESNCFLSLENGDSFPCVDEGYIFAPTATDILEQLWYKFELSFRINEKWVIREKKSLDDFSREFSVDNTNPHEAAAKAWLKMRTENSEK